MKTLYDITIDINHIIPEKYNLLIDFLEMNNIDYDETDFEELEIDNRSESEKYEDWLADKADEIHDEQMIEEI